MSFEMNSSTTSTLAMFFSIESNQLLIAFPIRSWLNPSWIHMKEQVLRLRVDYSGQVVKLLPVCHSFHNDRLRFFKCIEASCSRGLEHGQYIISVNANSGNAISCPAARYSVSFVLLLSGRGNGKPVIPTEKNSQISSLMCTNTRMVYNGRFQGLRSNWQPEKLSHQVLACFPPNLKINNDKLRQFTS